MANNDPKKIRQSKRPKMNIPRSRIRISDIRGYLREEPPPQLSGYLGKIERDFQAAAYILVELLGPDWIDYYVSNRGLIKSAGYFGNTEEFFLRVGSLADMLFNLQDVTGFRGCLELLASGQIEPALAELEVAKYLSFFGTRFRFNERTGQTKKDYDLVVYFPNGEEGIAETKFKIEGTPLREKTILHSLGRARSQMSGDRPSVIFMKVQQDWIANPRFDETVTAAIGQFFGLSKSVVAVEVFATTHETTRFTATPVVSGVEYLNGNHRFDATKSWALIGKIPAGTETRAPPWWKSISEIVDRSLDQRRMAAKV
jgi:hypothetical protein